MTINPLAVLPSDKTKTKYVGSCYLDVVVAEDRPVIWLKQIPA